MDRFTIRMAKKEDAAKIMEVNIKTWETAYASIVDPKFIEKRWQTYDASVERIASQIQNLEMTIFVAEIDGVIVGFASGGESRGARFEKELYAIYVIKEAQGLGIGHALFDRIKTLFIAQGAKQMIIWALAENPYRKFYERLGGKAELSKTRTFDEQVLDEVGYVFEWS